MRARAQNNHSSPGNQPGPLSSIHWAPQGRSIAVPGHSTPTQRGVWGGFLPAPAHLNDRLCLCPPVQGHGPATGSLNPCPAGVPGTGADVITSQHPQPLRNTSDGHQAHVSEGDNVCKSPPGAHGPRASHRGTSVHTSAASQPGPNTPRQHHIPQFISCTPSTTLGARPGLATHPVSHHLHVYTPG